MGRGADKKQRKKRGAPTEEQKKKRKKTIAAKNARKSAAQLAANNAARGNFIQSIVGHTSSSTSNAPTESVASDCESAAADDPTTPTENDNESEAIHESTASNASTTPAESNNDAEPIYVEESKEPEEEEFIITFSEDVIREIAHAPIIANLDVDDDDGFEDISDDEEESIDGDNTSATKKQAPAPSGMQQKYVCFLQRRIQYELSRDFPALDEKWLLSYLDKNDWKVRKGDALLVSEKLGLRKPVDGQTYSPNYYPAVHFWLPDVRYGMECMPCCPNCKTNKDVGVHGFHDKHFGRMIVGLHENYYAISRRYNCRCCKQKRAELKRAVEVYAEQSEVNVSVGEVKLRYTFMGWNSQSLPLFPDGRGDEFPAFLTWKAGVDKELIDLMRPLFDAGVRLERFSKLLLELHSKRHTRRHLYHERQLARMKRLNPNAMLEEYSEFGNKELYNGSVPTSKYISHVYRLFHETIRPYLDNEVKKRGA